MDKETAEGWIAEHFAPWLQGLAPEVEAMACTGARLRLPVTPALLTPEGTIARQALATLADLAMVLACAGHYREYRPVIATNLDLQYLQPAKGEAITCTATLLRPGKGVLFTRAMLTAEPSGREVAAATATFVPAG